MSSTVTYRTCPRSGLQFEGQAEKLMITNAVVAVVFSDGAFGNVKRIQRDSFGGRHIGVELHNPDFVALARSFGMNAVRAETANELGAALRRALASGGPALIEVPVGEMPSIWTLIRRPPSQGPAPSGG